MKNVPRVYWDSACFIAWLKPEKERRRACREVLHLAESGELLIVTSTLALVEVVKLDKGPLQVPEEKARTIRSFFRNRWIVPVQVTRTIAEDARQLVWTHGLRPRDSVHIATALWAMEHGGLKEAHSFDNDLLSLSGKVGDGTLHIMEPNVEQATLWAYEDAALDAAEESTN